MAQQPPIPGLFPPRRHTFAALQGACFFCVLLPCFLLWWHNRGQLPLLRGEGYWRPEDFAFLFVTAAILLTPGVLILGWIVLRALRRSLPPQADYHVAMVRGALLGSAMSYLNFPGFLGLIHLAKSSYPVLRLIVLYAVTGALCGAWVGWQAYREHHAEARLFPHFSLRTLMLVVLAWGVLAGFFMPR